jgi:hypothetical protein
VIEVETIPFRYFYIYNIMAQHFEAFLHEIAIDMHMTTRPGSAEKREENCANSRG